MGKKPNWSNPFSTYSILPHVLRTTTKFLAFLFLPYLESFPYSFSSLVALVSCSLNLSTWPLCLCFSKLRNNPCSRLLFHPNEKLFSRFIHLVLPSSRAAHQKISCLRCNSASPPHLNLKTRLHPPTSPRDPQEQMKTSLANERRATNEKLK